MPSLHDTWRIQDKSKYVFDVWYDFSLFTSGLYEIELQFTCANGSVGTYRDLIIVDEPLPVDEYPNSDPLVAVSSNDDQSLVAQINTQPSMIRKARRALFSPPPQNTLIVRVDQLGDLVTSIPAIPRLHELLPGARFVGLFSRANSELAESIHLFDEIIAIEFADDDWERRRILPLDKTILAAAGFKPVQIRCGDRFAGKYQLAAVSGVVRSSLCRWLQGRLIAVAIGFDRRQHGRWDQRVLRSVAFRASCCAGGVLRYPPRRSFADHPAQRPHTGPVDGVRVRGQLGVVGGIVGHHDDLQIGLLDDHRCHYDAEASGKEFACITHISLDEVFETVMKLV